MMRLCTLLLLIGLVAASTNPAQGQALATRKALTLEAAKQVAQAAEARATAEGWEVVIAIMDDAGHLLYLQRMDGAQRASIEVAQQKASSAALFRRSTKVFAEGLAAGSQGLLVLPHALPIEGGVPLVVDGVVVGSIGVSGVRPAQDGIIAEAGAAGLAAWLKQ